LSKLYRRAQRRCYVAPEYNPVALLDPREKPEIAPSSTRCLEVPEAALLLEMARTYPAKKHEPEMALAYPLMAAFLLTGGRAKEVLGLRLQDVSTDRQTVTFRPNEFHEGGRLKTRARLAPCHYGPNSRRFLPRCSTSGRSRAAGSYSARRMCLTGKLPSPTCGTC
jgi:integrase